MRVGGRCCFRVKEEVLDNVPFVCVCEREGEMGHSVEIQQALMSRWILHILMYGCNIVGLKLIHFSHNLSKLWTIIKKHFMFTRYVDIIHSYMGVFVNETSHQLSCLLSIQMHWDCVICISWLYCLILTLRDGVPSCLSVDPCLNTGSRHDEQDVCSLDGRVHANLERCYQCAKSQACVCALSHLPQPECLSV